MTLKSKYCVHLLSDGMLHCVLMIGAVVVQIIDCLVRGIARHGPWHEFHLVQHLQRETIERTGTGACSDEGIQRVAASN